MKISAVLLCLLFIVVSVSPWKLDSSDKTSPPAICCLSVINRMIPLRMLQSYERINSVHCPLEAVVFRTKRGRSICTDPRKMWVNRYMKALDKKSQIRSLEPSRLG